MKFGKSIHLSSGRSCRLSEEAGSVLVFGAGGFIGTYLIDTLASKGIKVIASDIDGTSKAFYKKAGIPFELIDISEMGNFSHINKYRICTIINLASQQPANVSEKHYNPRAYIDVNVIGLLNILEYCRSRSIKKIIHAVSHQNTRGLWKKGKPINENAPKAIKYTGDYAMFSISESAALDCMEYYRQSHGMQAIAFRLPPVYGYGPHTTIFKDGKPLRTGFQIFMDNAASGNPIEVWGDPEKGRDIIYVKDVVAAIILALRSNTAAGLYNITSGKKTTLWDEARAISEVFATGKKRSKLVLKREIPNNIESFVYDNSKAQKELGWKPEYSFKDMLKDYKKEMSSRRFEYLLKKRERMIKEG